MSQTTVSHSVPPDQVKYIAVLHELNFMSATRYHLNEDNFP
jgi:hypothetical protein